MYRSLDNGDAQCVAKSVEVFLLITNNYKLLNNLKNIKQMGQAKNYQLKLNFIAMEEHCLLLKINKKIKTKKI